MNLLEPVVFLDPPGDRFLLNSSGSRGKEAVRSRMESSGDMDSEGLDPKVRFYKVVAKAAEF